jgi:hypothetical protein
MGCQYQLIYGDFSAEKCETLTHNLNLAWGIKSIKKRERKSCRSKSFLPLKSPKFLFIGQYSV